MGPLGAQFMLWEVATAVAGRLLSIDPFDQPDVESAKAAGPRAAGCGDGLAPRARATSASRRHLTARRRDIGAAVDELLAQVGPQGTSRCRSTSTGWRTRAGCRRGWPVRRSRPVTFGWGPRFLHSTGQYHKGGTAVGVFLQVTATPLQDLAGPGPRLHARRVHRSQAAGDAQVLRDKGRPVLRLHLHDLDAGRSARDRKDAKGRHEPADRHNPLRDPRDHRLPRIAGPCGIVMFGVTGDLARKKLIPAIYDLANRGLLPPGFGLVGFARRDWGDRHFGKLFTNAVKADARTECRESVWSNLAAGIRFVPGQFDDTTPGRSWPRRSSSSTSGGAPAATTRSTSRSRPARSPRSVDRSTRAAWPAPDGRRWRRVVIEKPFGHDLEQRTELNDIVGNVFESESVFRIDHYLGKETVQNILALRFANQMFEPVWNANYVDHVQITMAEDIGIGGRAGYYDGIGAARDVIQNHLLQLLALIAMEEPVSFDAEHLRAEKEKVLRSVRLPDDLDLHTARAQYVEGWRRPARRGLPRRGRHRPQVAHRDLRRPAPGHRLAPLGGRPVLPAHRQATRPARHRGRGGLQEGAPPAVREHRRPSWATTPS